MVAYELFCIYGFCVNYPHDFKPELNPKSQRKKGDVAFISPTGMRVYVSWRPLEELKKKYSSLDEHAKDTFSRIKKGSEAGTAELIQTETTYKNKHKAVFSHGEVSFSSPSLIPFRKKKGFKQEFHFMHIYCEPSQRCFSIYGMTTPETYLEQIDVLKKMSKSLRCHAIATVK